MRASGVYVGTAGWSIPSSYAAQFPTAGSQLAKYATRLNAVEINSSFHRAHRHETYRRWADTVREDFRFSVKVPKAITHEHALGDCAGLLDDFVEEVSGLGKKLGMLLLQLPPSLEFARDVANAFFVDIRAKTLAPIACEPRHPSWFSAAANRCLSAHRVARVAADPKPVEAAGEPAGWSGSVYYRLHGSPRRYYSDYPTAVLRELHKRLDKHRAAGQEAWVIFDNTAAGFALGNALDVASGHTVHQQPVRRRASGTATKPRAPASSKRKRGTSRRAL